ncbi:MAG: tetratricopeptide repeat protein [Stappiaceae bacterium]
MSSLQQHLLVLQEQALQRKSLIGKIGKSAIEVAAQLAGSAAVVGEPIGVLKFAYDLYKIASEDNSSREPDVAERAIAAVRAFFDATKAVRIPFVLFLDDIQFSTGEKQLSKFVRQLLIDAQERSRPLLVIATCWHQEWSDTSSEYPIITVLKEARLLRHIHAENLKIHPIEPLRGVEGKGSLEPLITNSFPGLTERQVLHILEKVDGNPLYLEEIILYLGEEDGFFQNFDRTKELEPDAMENIDRMNIESVVRKRYQKAGIEIFAPLALGSLQGVRFSKSIVMELFERLPQRADFSISEQAFARAKNPHGFLGEDTSAFSEFVQRLHHKVARELLANVSKPKQSAEECLEALVREKIIKKENNSPEEWIHVCELAVELFQDNADPETQLIVMIALQYIGDEAQKLFAFEDAITAYDRAIQIGSRLEATNGPTTPPAFINDQAAAHVNKGNALQSLQRLDEAVAAQDVAIKILEALRKRMGDATPPAFLDDLAAAYMNKGNTQQSLQRLDEAVAAYDAAIEIRERLQERLGNDTPPKFLSNLAKAHDNKGVALRSLQRLEEAIAAHDVAIEIRERLQRRMGETTPFPFIDFLANSYVNKGNALHDLQRLDEVVAANDAAIEIMDALLKRLGDATPLDFLRTLAIVRINKGRLLHALLRLDEAIATHDAAIKILDGLQNRLGDATPPAFLRDLATTYMNKSVTLRGLKRLDQAVTASDAAIKIHDALRKRLGDATPSEFLNSLASACVNKGNALQNLQRLDEAIANYDDAIEIMDALQTRLGDATPPIFLNDLATAYSNKSLALRGLKRPDEAVTANDAAIKIGDALRKRLGVATPPHFLSRLAIAHSNKGIALQDLRQLDAANMSLQSARKILADLVEQFPQSTEYRHSYEVVCSNIVSLD